MNRGFLILHAEDSRFDAEIFAHAVKDGSQRARIPVQLAHVSDGEEAIAYLGGEGRFADCSENPHPDMLITDVKMPLVSGIELLCWMKERHEYLRTPKIVLSGSDLRGDMEAAYRQGAHTYFQKPADMEIYRDMVYCLIKYWGHTPRPDYSTPRPA